MVASVQCVGVGNVDLHMGLYVGVQEEGNGQLAVDNSNESTGYVRMTSDPL